MPGDHRRIVIDDPPEAQLTLSVGLVTVRAAGVCAERELRWRARRPLAANYRAFTNAVLSGAVHPPLSPTVVDGLPDRDRAKLMLAVVRLRDEERRWQQLYGAPLSPDERFFAVMLWSRGERAVLLARFQADQARALREVHARTLASIRESVLPALGSTRAPSWLLRPDKMRSLAAGMPPLKGYDRMFERSAYMRLVGGGRSASALAAFGTIGKTPTLLANLGVADVARSEALRAHIRYAPRRDLTVSARVQASAARFDTTRAMRAALGNPLAVSALKDLGGLRFADARLASPFLPAVDPSRIAGQVAAALHRPLFDGRTRLLLESGGIRALFRALRMPTVDIPRFHEVLAPMLELQEALAEVDEFFRDWENDPLWFLLSVFGMGDARRFVGLERQEVEEALLRALAEVVCDGEFVAAIRRVLSDAPYLTDLQRDWLDHALEHAAAGEWRQAVPPMLAGLEGALHQAAVGRSLIVDRGGKFMAAEAVVKRMALDEGYTLFVVRRVFGGIGNSFRHGRADSGERDQVLFAVVALVGWLDFFLELNAMRVLVCELCERLDVTIPRVATPVPELMTET